jgi:hypothetical protein
MKRRLRLNERAADVVITINPDAAARRTSANPMAAQTPESGTGTTTSAATGCSRARGCAPDRSDLVDAAAEDDVNVRSREVDVLENAMPKRAEGKRLRLDRIPSAETD